jgi:hypothetical protein
VGAKGRPEAAAWRHRLPGRPPTTSATCPPTCTPSCSNPARAAVRAIEDCIGIGSSAGKAPIIPKRCQDRAALLEACLESKQAIAEAKTSRCSGPQPIPAAPEAAPAPPRKRGRPRKNPEAALVATAQAPADGAAAGGDGGSGAA